jgi:WD40 repeat protein
VLASGSDKDGTIELWSLPDGRPLRTLNTRLYCESLVISPDGCLLGAGDIDGSVRLWGSELVRLSRIPVGRMAAQDAELAQDALGDSTLSPAERAALEFIVALLRWRRRFDVHLDDAPRHIAVGEFDIEIAG